jgi:hypothetical protein
MEEPPRNCPSTDQVAVAHGPHGASEAGGRTTLPGLPDVGEIAPLPLPPACGLPVGIAREYDQLRDPMRVANVPTWRPQKESEGCFAGGF